MERKEKHSRKRRELKGSTERQQSMMHFGNGSLVGTEDRGPMQSGRS